VGARDLAGDIEPEPDAANRFMCETIVELAGKLA
jgi:hypothetical protein